MSRLTIQQAEAEAKWRWGSLFVRGFAHFDATVKRPFQVGTICLGSVRIRGQGASWEGAFSDAARQTNTEAASTSPAARKAGRPVIQQIQPKPWPADPVQGRRSPQPEAITGMVAPYSTRYVRAGETHAPIDAAAMNASPAMTPKR